MNANSYFASICVFYCIIYNILYNSYEKKVNDKAEKLQKFINQHGYNKLEDIKDPKVKNEAIEQAKDIIFEREKIRLPLWEKLKSHKDFNTLYKQAESKVINQNNELLKYKKECYELRKEIVKTKLDFHRKMKAYKKEIISSNQESTTNNTNSQNTTTNTAKEHKPLPKNTGFIKQDSNKFKTNAATDTLNKVQAAIDKNSDQATFNTGGKLWEEEESELKKKERMIYRGW